MERQRLGRIEIDVMSAQGWSGSSCGTWPELGVRAGVP